MVALCNITNILLVLAVVALARTAPQGDHGMNQPSDLTGSTTVKSQDVKGGFLEEDPCNEEVRAGRMCFELCYIKEIKVLNEQQLVSEELLRAHMGRNLGNRPGIAWNLVNQDAKKCAKVVKEAVNNCERARQVHRCILDL